MKEASQAVVVFGGHRIEFVVMASRATDGQRLGGFRECIDAVVDNIVADTEEPTADSEESRGRKRRFNGVHIHLAIGRDKLVASDLVNKKLVEGKVFVKRVDYPVAINVRMDEL